MPILDKMNTNHLPDDSNGHQDNGGDQEQTDKTMFPKPEPVMRKRKGPEFLTLKRSGRYVSLAGIMEKIYAQFQAEHTPDDSAIRAAKNRTDRLKLLNPVIDYVIAQESLDVDSETKAHIIRVAYSALFGLGALDELVEDMSITTVTLEGEEKISVRRGHGELEPLDMIFEDYEQMRETVKRIAQRGGGILDESLPLIEVGFKTESERFVSASIAVPPVVPFVTVDMRLHPTEAPTLAKFIQNEVLNEKAAVLLRALMESQHGFTLVGQPESGKTMLLSAMLAHLPHASDAVSVERTGELHLPTNMRRVVPVWPDITGEGGVTFGEQIESVAKENVQVLVLDEVRADEPHTIAPVLRMEDAPRMIWSVRGTPDSKRLSSALTMLAHRSDMTNGGLLAKNLFERLPFVVSVRRINGNLQLREVGEWYDPDGAGYIRYRALMQSMGGQMLSTGEQPDRDLGLDAIFWDID